MKQACHFGIFSFQTVFTDIRLDIEAAAAYAFPPVTGVALLVLEHNNSYIRFHAWQAFSFF
jgi:uncharacterized membrane protein